LLLDISDIVLSTKVGEGSFGVVWEGTFRSQNVAVKFQTLSEDLAEISQLRSELSLLKHMRHSNLVEFIGASLGKFPSLKTDEGVRAHNHDGPTVAIIMELCREGCLSDALQGNIPQRTLVKVARDIASGLEHLHHFGIIHRDVKPENVLLTEEWRGKICDYGLCVHEESPERLEFYGGTEEYSAPELILAEDYNTMSDIFSLGLTYVEMMTQSRVGKNGFLERGPREMFALDGDVVRDAIYASDRAQADEPPASLVELAVQCVEYEPVDRPPIKEVLEWLDELLNDPEFNLDGEEEDELVRPSEFMERFSIGSVSDSGRTLSTVQDDARTASNRSLSTYAGSEGALSNNSIGHSSSTIQTETGASTEGCVGTRAAGPATDQDSFDGVAANGSDCGGVVTFEDTGRATFTSSNTADTSDNEEIVLQSPTALRARANTNPVKARSLEATTPPRRSSMTSMRVRMGSHDSEDSPGGGISPSGRRPTTPNNTTPSRRELLPKVDGAEKTKGVSMYFLSNPGQAQWKSRPQRRRSAHPEFNKVLFVTRAKAWYDKNAMWAEDAALHAAWKSIEAIAKRLFDQKTILRGGNITRIELMRALKTDRDLATVLQIPRVHNYYADNEEATEARETFERVFEMMDTEDNQSISVENFLDFATDPHRSGIQSGTDCMCQPIYVVRTKWEWRVWPPCC